MNAVLVTAALFALAACKHQPVADAGSGEAAASKIAAEWPATLRVVGDGFPKPGDPCRVIGETAATNDYLDDSATLTGCLSADEAAKLGGKIVATIDGVTLVSVPDPQR